MRCFIVATLLSCAVFTSAVAQTDCLRLTETNLISFCADNCEIAAHVKVASLAFVRKPKEPNVIDLSVFGRLMTLEVKSVYFAGRPERIFRQIFISFEAAPSEEAFLIRFWRSGVSILCSSKRTKCRISCGMGL